MYDDPCNNENARLRDVGGKALTQRCLPEYSDGEGDEAEPRHVRDHEPVDAGANGRQRLRRDPAAEDEPRNRGPARRCPTAGVCAAGAVAQDRAGLAEIVAAQARFCRAWRYDCEVWPLLGLAHRTAMHQSIPLLLRSLRKVPVSIKIEIEVSIHPIAE